MIQDHDTLTIEDFGGLFGRDGFTDSVPANHVIDSLNTMSQGFEIGTRNGFPAISVNFPGIRRFHTYKREGEANRDLVLNHQGQLFDIAFSTVTPILTIAAMKDFAVCQFYDRIYISPHNGVKGLPGEKVYVYTGDGTIRQAGGLGPSGSFTATLTSNPGNIEKGTHVLAFCFVTKSGYVTPPGPTTGSFPTFVADSKHTVNITGIPVGPPGTIQRRLLSTRAIEVYNGDQEAYEYFFVPGGTINDNTTTTLEINYFDAALESSADYTFNQLGTIPAGVFMAQYRRMMIVGGEDANPSMARVSKSDEPESFNELAGFMICDPNETVGLKSGIEYRDNFYLFKGPIPSRTYTTHDNGFEASTWPVITVDHSIGCDVNGSSQYLDAKGSNTDFYLVADAAGLYSFNGSYDVANPISGKIDNWWQRINKKAFNKLQLVIDPKKLLLYVLAPIDNETEARYIFVGNYENGLTSGAIVWHIWTMASNSDILPTSINVHQDFITKKTVFRVAGYDGHIFNQQEGPLNYNDNGFAFDNYIQFALLTSEQGWINSFNAARFRMYGVGNTVLTATGLDYSNLTNLPNFALSNTPGGEKIVPFLLVNERCSIKVRLTQINNYFKIKRIELFGRKLWATRA